MPTPLLSLEHEFEAAVTELGVAVAFEVATQGLEQEWRSAKREILRAKLLPDLVYVLIQAQVAFRPGTTVQFTYRRDGKGPLS